MASLKLCATVSGRKIIRRSRIDSLQDFTYSALKKIVVDSFPDLSGLEELGYEDDEGELVTLVNDSDLAECVACMDVAAKKTLRIEIITQEPAAGSGKLVIETGSSLSMRSSDPGSSAASPVNVPGACAFCGEEAAGGSKFCSEDCANTAASFSAPFLSPAHSGGASARANAVPVGVGKLQAALDALHIDGEPVLMTDDARQSIAMGIAASDAYRGMPAPIRGTTPYSMMMSSNGYHAEVNPVARVTAASNTSSITARLADSVSPPPQDDSTASTPAAYSTSNSPTFEHGLNEPSVCIPWVSPEVGREVIVATFEQFGTVKQVDLVPREDHFLCFVHFEKWKTDEPAVVALRTRLMNPPSLDFKESVEYMHPITGKQRWLFSRSRVPPRSTGSQPSGRPAPMPESGSTGAPSAVNPFGLGVVGISVPASATRLGCPPRQPSCPPPPVSPAFVAPHEPSLCVPWVRQNVTRELLTETFSPYGSVKQVDLVPKGDHYLCFIHFHSWKLEDPVACAVRARLLNPPTPDHKETIYYMHPTLGRQRWLFARSWVAPQQQAQHSTGASPSPHAPSPLGAPHASSRYCFPGGPSPHAGRFSTGGIFSSGSGALTSPALPDAFTNGPAFFEEENPMGFSGYAPSFSMHHGAPASASRASMYTRSTGIGGGYSTLPHPEPSPSLMKADWSMGMPSHSTQRMPF